MSNTWFRVIIKRAQHKYLIVLNPSHLVCVSRIAFQIYCTTIQDMKRSYVEHKQMELHCISLEIRDLYVQFQVPRESGTYQMNIASSL